MKNFSYNTKPQEMSAEEVLTNRKKRLRKQQIVFGCIFAAVVLVLAIYVVRRVVYTYYDGYVKLERTKAYDCEEVWSGKREKITTSLKAQVLKNDCKVFILTPQK